MNQEKDQAIYTAICVNDDFKEIFTLVTKDNLNNPDMYGRTPLHHAIQKGNITVIKKLLDMGADVHIKDESGETPLYVATYLRNIDVINLLIEHNATIDINTKNIDNVSPMDFVKFHINNSEIEAIFEQALSGDVSEIDN